MKTFFKTTTALVLAGTVLSGCMSSTLRQSALGQFDEMSSGNLEARYKSESVHDLLYLCEALEKTQKFSDFDKCFSHLEERAKTEKFVAQMGVSLNQAHADALVYNLKATKHLSMGEIKEAINAGERAMVAINSNPMTIIPFGANQKGKMIEDRLKLPTVGVLSIAYALDGNAKKAKEYNDFQLNRFKNDYLESMTGEEDQLKSWVARYYFTSGKYEEAYQFMKTEKYSEGQKAAQTVVNGFTNLMSAPLLLISAGATIDQMTERMFFPKQVMFAISASNSGHLSEARKAFDTVLQHSMLSNFGNFHFLSFYESGKLALKQKDIVLAKQHFEQAITILENQRANLRTENYKLGFIGNKFSVYSDMIKLLLDEGKYAEAFEYVERGKARALVDMLAQRKDFGSTASNAALSELDELEKKSIQTASVQGSGSTVRKIDLGDFWNKISSSPTSELASLVTVNKLSVADIQKEMQSGEVALEYYGAGDDFYAFVVTQNSVNAVKLQGKGLAGDVAALRKNIQDYPSKGYVRATRNMYNRVIKPVAHLIKGKKLTIIPHGALHYLPFAALNDGRRYLVDKFDLRFLPSASVMTFLNKPSNSSADLLAFGNPDLGNPEFDLPGAQAETKVINRGWKDAKVLLRKHASEANFKKFAPSFKYLHLASHGEFNTDEPLQSRMLLAPGEGEDGNLTVDELYTMRLNADLVTLSACETGLGDVANGDDVIGLTRGFLFAGAKSIVASLWPVSDEATAYLMKNFYKNLKSMKKDAALRKALVSTKSKYPHPVFWSAFQMTGAS